MLRDRSWASSMMIVSYARSSRSVWISASRMPSVISLTKVASGFTWSVNRTFQPTASPSGVSSSSATRSATVRAAIRRGWVCPIMPRDAPAQLHADLRDLRGLPGAGLTGDDHDLVVTDGLRDLVLLLADRQLLGIRDRRARGARRSAMRGSALATSASISARTAARASGLRILRAPSSLRPSRCASRRDSSARRGARAPRAGAGCVDIPDPGSHLGETRGERFCVRPSSRACDACYRRPTARRRSPRPRLPTKCLLSGSRCTGTQVPSMGALNALG